MDDYLAANRALWDEWTAIHELSSFYDLESFKAGGSRLRAYEVNEVGEVAGKSLLHLQCHFGIDALSWARHGARVTGADFSARAVELARSLAAELRLDATFVRSDLYDLPSVLDGQFDIVYTSRGVLGWLPDLDRWAGVVAHFLRPGGVFYVTEIHPVAEAFADEPGLRLGYPYFRRPEPLVLPVQGSYADPTAQVRQPVEYGWAHSMGEIVTAVAGAGLRIEFLHELPFVDWPLRFLVRHDDGTWRLPPDAAGKLPLFFSLRATSP